MGKRKRVLAIMVVLSFILASIPTMPKTIKADDQTSTVKVDKALFGDGNMNLAIDTNGNLWSWGTGVLGDGNNFTAEYSSPKQIIQGTKFSMIDDRYYGGGALDTDGNLWVWGLVMNGALGNGSKTGSLMPIKILDGQKIIDFSLEDEFGAAVDTDGNIWAWGNGFIGNGDVDRRNRNLTPVKVKADVRFQSVNLFDLFSASAIDTDGGLWVWGEVAGPKSGLIDESKLIETDDATGMFTVKVAAEPIRSMEKMRFSEVEINSATGTGIDIDGNLWIWGNIDILLKNGASATREPIQIMKGYKFKEIQSDGSTLLALDEDGILWVLSNEEEYNSLKGDKDMIPLMGEKKIQRIAEGGVYHDGAIDSNGDLWIWGYKNDDYGESYYSIEPELFSFDNNEEEEKPTVPADITVSVGNKATVKASKKITKWESSDPSIVSVKKSGKKKAKISGISQGTATITAYSGKGNKQKVVKTWTIAVE